VKELDLNGAREAYKEKYGKEVAICKKNDKAWIKSKI
jgi:hypothetical protein